MHGKKTCWEVIEESLIRYHQKKEKRACFPLFQYVLGHFRFFHRSDTDLAIEEYVTELNEWRGDKKRM